jgi:8-hydroxy-5-deazaflavin:NADPH oxidoreductase
MKIGFIGAGHIGSNAARLFVKAGHSVALSNSRGPESLSELVSELGNNAQAVSVEEAIEFGDIVFVSIPLGHINEIPTKGFDGKIVIDTNNYYPQRDGNIVELDSGETTSSELLEKRLPGARIVKAFNTIWFEHLRTQGDTSLPPERRRAIFVAGDDRQAKDVVAKLIDEIGFAAVDTGSLQEGGKRQQTDSPIYNKDLTAVEAAKALKVVA